MSSLIRPSTPVAKVATPSSTPVGGTWRHPKMDEITRRQNASRFTDSNVKKVFFNLLGIVVLFYSNRLLRPHIPVQAVEIFGYYATYLYYAAHLLLLLNITVSVWPLFRAIDDFSDIPLTPAQRKLLGLPPTSKPPTPGSTYSTPPRFARTPTPNNSPANKIGNFSNSPSGSPGSRSVSGSPFSPGNSTPYAKKAMGGAGFDGSRRYSYGSPSPLGPAGSRSNSSMLETPSTPTPAAGKGATVGLNNRWLYEKGRRNSGNAARLY